MLTTLKELFVNGLNTLGIANSDGLVRTLTEINTIKAISEEILGIHRATITKINLTEKI